MRLLIAQPRLIGWMSLCLILIINMDLVSAALRDDYSSFIGGNSTDTIYDIVVDDNGDVYLTGATFSDEFDVFSLESDTLNQDAFVIKLTDNGTIPAFIKFLHGEETDAGRAIAIDDDYIYVTGETNSVNFMNHEMNPAGHNRLSTQRSGSWDSFLVKLEKATGNVVFTRYVGGNGVDFGHGIAAMDDQTVVIVGETWSTDLPTTDNAFLSAELCTTFGYCDLSQDVSGRSNGFVMQYNTRTERIEYATYIGGSKDDKVHSVTVHEGLIHVVGETNSPDIDTKAFISTNARLNLNSQSSQKFDGFIVVYDPSPFNGVDTMVFASYIGGNGNDFAQDVAVDPAGNLYIVGTTQSDNFPTQKSISFDRVCGSNQQPCDSTSEKPRSDAFVIKLQKAQPYQLVYSSFVGGTGNEAGLAITVATNGDFMITGKTNSNDFPYTANAKTKRCLSGTGCNTQDDDAFLVKFSKQNQDYPELVYSSYLRGSQDEESRGISINSTNDLYVGGSTDSIDFDNINQINDSTVMDQTCGTDGACNSDELNNRQTDAFIMRFSALGVGQVVNPPDKLLDPPPPKRSGGGGGSGAIFLLLTLMFLLVLSRLGAKPALYFDLASKITRWKSIQQYVVRYQRLR